MKKAIKTILIAGGAFFFLVLIIGFIASAGSEEGIKEAATKENKGEPEEVQNWEYETSEDEMDGSNQFYATTESTNQVEFEFPYHGGSKMTLYVRNMGSENEVFIRIHPGQLIPGDMNNETLRIKIDNESPEEYSYTSSSSGDPEYGFITNSSKLLNKLKHASKLKIEAHFFQTGGIVFDFDVSDLKWEH